VLAELASRKRRVAAGRDLEAEWNSFRKCKAGREWAALLSECTGARERCMYCSDSRAVDVEHYRPVAGYPELTFTHKNHLYVCSACNRSKGNRFPTGIDGSPLLINPFQEDPWGVLFVDVDTGVIVGRWQPNNEEDERGRTALELLAPLSSSAAEIGRARSAAQLREAAEKVMLDGAKALPALLRATDEDDYDMASWFLLWEGRRLAEFAQMRDNEPIAHRRFARRVVKKRHGVV
jgi:hypothetical protein